MKLASDNIYFSGLLESADMKKLLADTGAGLETIQFGVSDNLDHFEETLAKEKKELILLGEPAVTVHGPFLDLNPMCYDRMVREVTMLRFNQAYQAAEKIGASKIVFHSCMVPTVYFLYGWAERMADFWKEFLEGKDGIQICMENVLDREVEPFAEVADRVQHPDFGICLDVGHAWCYSNHEVAEWVDVLKPYIRHMHLHDNDKSYDQHLALGEGNVPWENAVRTMLARDPSVTLTIENSDPEKAYSSWRQLQRVLRDEM